MTAPHDSASSTDKTAGIGCVMRLVVLLQFSDDDGKEKRLLPGGRLAGAIKPSVGRLAWAAQGGHDHGGGIRGERISEGHGQILPDKKKYAMQKINLAKCPQCRHITRMSNANLNQLALREIELRNQFVRMTSEDIREMMNTTDNTTTRLICWEYLQTL
jgi:hypothetical protein